MQPFKLEQLEFKLASQYNLPLVKQFYKKNGMRAQAPKGDQVYIASSNNSIVAALRLHPVNACYLLRSMCVSAQHRKLGIGSALLAHLQPTLSSIECYSFPFSHLTEFYNRAGFILIEAHLAPEAISDKFNRYLQNGKKIRLMKHQAESA